MDLHVLFFKNFTHFLTAIWLPHDKLCGVFWEEISESVVVHMCYAVNVQSCAIHNSFDLYDRNVICACCANKAHCQ